MGNICCSAPGDGLVDLPFEKQLKMFESMELTESRYIPKGEDLQQITSLFGKNCFIDIEGFKKDIPLT